MNKKFLNAKIKSIGDASITFVFSKEVVDRHGDVIDIESVKFDNFLNNPVFLPQHRSNELPIGKVTRIWVEDKADGKELLGEVVFAVDEYPLAKTYYKLYKNEFLNAVSIGFLPGRVEQMEVNDSVVTIIYDAELLEVSAVSIPANQLALAVRKGIDITPFKKEVIEEAKKLAIQSQELLKALEAEEKKVDVITNFPKVEKKKKAIRYLLKAIRNIQ